MRNNNRDRDGDGHGDRPQDSDSQAHTPDGRRDRQTGGHFNTIIVQQFRAIQIT